jgi:hypothetical protein
VGVSDRGVKLTTHLHQVPRTKMREVIPLLPSTPSWCGAQLKHRDSFISIILTAVVVKMA